MAGPELGVGNICPIEPPSPPSPARAPRAGTGMAPCRGQHRHRRQQRGQRPTKLPNPRCDAIRQDQVSIAIPGRTATTPNPCNRMSASTAPPAPAILLTCRVVAVFSDGSRGSYVASATRIASRADPAKGHRIQRCAGSSAPSPRARRTCGFPSSMSRGHFILLSCLRHRANIRANPLINEVRSSASPAPGCYVQENPLVRTVLVVWERATTPGMFV